MRWETLRKFLLLVLIIIATMLIGKPEFHPKTPEQRLEAIGPLDGLSEVEKKAFDPANGFVPLGKPEPADWLSQYPERGQTFPAYARSGFNPFKPPTNKIYLQPLGDLSSGSISLDDLRDFTGRFFAAEVVLLDPMNPDRLNLTTRQNPHSGHLQVKTGDILNVLKTRLASDAYCVLGVTLLDLYPGPEWNFVFGEATLEERVGVFSFARYDPVFYGAGREAGYKTLMLRRSCKVLAHELGHMFGIHHCVYFQCLMNGSNHLRESDSRPLHLCPVCLRKFALAIGFDLVERYRSLAEFYRKVGFTDETGWIESRLKVINP